MNKTFFVAIVGTVVPIIMAFVFAYWAWVSYLGFYNSVFFVSTWENFNTMVVTLFISGFFAGMSGAIVPMVSSMRKEARKKQEKERLKEEIRKELEMETQKQVAS